MPPSAFRCRQKTPNAQRRTQREHSAFGVERWMLDVRRFLATHSCRRSGVNIYRSSGAFSKRRRTSGSLKSSIRTIFSRDFSPCSRTMSRTAICNFAARNFRNAALALPSTAGARNLILMALPCPPRDGLAVACSPAILSCFAFGTTWIRSLTTSDGSTRWIDRSAGR